ncbi:MAG: hypothetical protein QXZ36_07360, partial [Thermoproteota archaeon]
EDLEEMILAPGFIDTHLHGYAGIDVTFASAEELLELAALLPQIGVTAFLPTVLTACHEDFVRACETIALAKRLQGESLNGARILGVNLEGPCLNPERIGAQNSRWVRPPNRQEFEEYWRASKGGIRIVTLAPELPGAHELISWLTELGVIVSIGHTNASYFAFLVHQLFYDFLAENLRIPTPSTSALDSVWKNA